MIRKKLIRILLILLPACAGLSLGAQDRLPHPLRFVPADSTLIWGLDNSHLTSTALKADRSLSEQPFSADGVSKKAFRAAVRAWKESVLPTLSLTGGDDGKPAGAQAVAAANTLAAAARLFLLTGEAEYAEVMERSLFNALLAEASAKGPLTFEKHFAARALRNGAGTMYAYEPGGTTLYVNYYSNSSTRINTGGVRLSVEQLTGMPHSGRVKLRIEGMRSEQTPVKILLRIPMWAMRRPYPGFAYAVAGEALPMPVVYVNGKELLAAKTERGFLVIDRKWNNGDEILFDLPDTPFVLRRKADGKAVRGSVAVQRGPFVYALRGDMPAGHYFSTNRELTEEVEDGSDGNVLLRGSLFRDAGTPADAPAPEVPLLLFPFKDVKGAFWLREPR